MSDPSARQLPMKDAVRPFIGAGAAADTGFPTDRWGLKRKSALMTTYFNLVTLMTVLLLVAFAGLVSSSHNLDRLKRRTFLLSALIVCIASISGWVGVIIDGIMPQLRWLHMIMTPLEFTSACAAAFTVGFTVRSKITPVTKLAFVLVILHGILEVISAFTGFIYRIDADNLYHKGPCYWIYITFYMLSIIYIFGQTNVQRKAYQNRNLLSLFFILVFLMSGIVIVLTVSGVHLIWLTIAISELLYYCYYIDMDSRIDGLTGLLNRKDYDTYMRSVSGPITIVILDVNNFKSVNDSYGHDYGDHCLKKIAQAMLVAFRDCGLCYRYGGDEFCVVSKLGSAVVEQSAKEMVRSLVEQRETDPRLPLVAYGLSEVTDPRNFEEGFREADRRMYENKQRAKAGR